MQQRFAELVVFGGPDGPLTQTEAAKIAGYSEKRCRQEGSELLNPKLSPLVVQYVSKLKGVKNNAKGLHTTKRRRNVHTNKNKR